MTTDRRDAVELGDLTRFDSPRQLAAFVGLIPSEHSSGQARRQGGITKAGNGRARRALIEGAWAYRHPAKVSEHIRRRIGALPKPIQDIGWKAQVRLCKRFRRLVARGEHPNVAVTAIARELIAFMWAIAKEVPITTSASIRSRVGVGVRPRFSTQPSSTLGGGLGRPSCLTPIGTCVDVRSGRLQPAGRAEARPYVRPSAHLR